jgi:hypothetical protein
MPIKVMPTFPRHEPALYYGVPQTCKTDQRLLAIKFFGRITDSSAIIDAFRKLTPVNTFSTKLAPHFLPNFVRSIDQNDRRYQQPRVRKMHRLRFPIGDCARIARD